jgi:hypothetical protein
MLVPERHRKDGLGVKQFPMEVHKVVPRPLQSMPVEEPVPTQLAELLERLFNS